MPLGKVEPGREVGAAYFEVDDEFDEPFTAEDDEIDDPDLLEQAERAVRDLRPGRELDGAPAGWTLSPPAAPEPKAEVEDPRPVSYECPNCGRQAQRGWEICPWCRAPLPERPVGSIRGDFDEVE